MNKEEYMEQQEQEFEEARRRQIAIRAAKLVVVHKTPRDQAIRHAQETQDVLDEAATDPHGVISTLEEAQEPKGARSPKEAAQVAAVSDEIYEILEGRP